MQLWLCVCVSRELRLRRLFVTGTHKHPESPQVITHKLCVLWRRKFCCVCSLQIVPSRPAASCGLLSNGVCHHCLYMANRWSAKPIWRFASVVPHKLKSFLQQTVHNTKNPHIRRRHRYHQESRG